MKAVSTGDIDLSVLRETAEELGPEIELEVSDRQIFLKSAEPPSWVTFLADADWWVQAGAAYAALYVAEIIKEAAKESWKNRAKVISTGVAATGNLMQKFASSLAALRERLGPRTRLEVGLPFPEEYWSTRLEISGSDVAEIALQLALFVHHIPALQALISKQGLDSSSVAAGLRLNLLSDGSLEVSWQDGQTLHRQQRVIPLRATGSGKSE